MRHSAGAESIATPDYLDHSDPSIVVGTLSFFLFIFIFSYPRLPRPQRPLTVVVMASFFLNLQAGPLKGPLARATKSNA